jgi:hypothetical protein
MNRIIVMMALMFAPIAAPGAHASRPVKKTVTACVVNGTLTSGPYTYRVRRDVGSADLDLKRYESKRIRVRGYLLPGDILIAKSIKIVSKNCP